MSGRLEEGNRLTIDEIMNLARDLVEESGDRQEDVAAAIERDQSQVSRALQGEQRYVRACVDIIEHYTDFQIDYPVGYVSKRSGEK